MAGASMIDIKARIKSVESTMQITKAMELVATSKLRRQREKLEKTRPFCSILSEAIQRITSTQELGEGCWFDKREGKTLYVMIAGDRGLAGGYNANVFRMSELLSKGREAAFLPVGKKAAEYCRHKKKELFGSSLPFTSEVGVGDAFDAAKEICAAYISGEITSVVLVYTKFHSMISQISVYEELLPVEKELNGEKKSSTDPIFEEDAEQMLEKIIPEYVGGVLYSAICEALASESGARRSAMNSANKNAGEMIDTLMLKYNRARQAVITQEITEIVSGAEAL